MAKITWETSKPRDDRAETVEKLVKQGVKELQETVDEVFEAHIRYGKQLDSS